MIKGLCESLIRKMDDDKAKKVLEEIETDFNEEDYAVLENICEHIAYDRSLCKSYGIEYDEIDSNWNKVRLASYYEYGKTLGLYNVSRMHRKNILIIEKNGVQKAVVKAA